MNQGTTLSLSTRGTPNNKGTLEIYQWSGNDWIQKGDSFVGIQAHQFFGAHAILSTDGSAVAFADLGVGGSVSVYDWDGSDWIQRANNLNPLPPDTSSHHTLSSSASGDVILVASSGETTPAVYTWIGAELSVSYLDSYSNVVEHQISADGNTIILRGNIDNSPTNVVDVYQKNSEGWIKTTVADVIYASAGTSLSEDGTVIAFYKQALDGSPAVQSHVLNN